LTGLHAFRYEQDLEGKTINDMIDPIKEALLRALHAKRLYPERATYATLVTFMS
jgi:hypothetical protein